MGEGREEGGGRRGREEDGKKRRKILGHDLGGRGEAFLTKKTTQAGYPVPLFLGVVVVKI